MLSTTTNPPPCFTKVTKSGQESLLHLSGSDSRHSETLRGTFVGEGGRDLGQQEREQPCLPGGAKQAGAVGR